MISVVLPVFDEARNGWSARIRERFAEVPGYELLRVGPSSGRTRAQRLQAGIEAARGETILLHHPRSLIEADGLRFLLEREDELTWGGFTHAFDEDHPLLRFTSWYSNRVRAARAGIVYLDHCVFFRRELLTRPIPAVEIFEDTELSLILRAGGPPAILPYRSTTSAIRFKTNGIWRQALMNQRLKLEYRLGVSDRLMNARYERGLRLNG